MCHIIRKKKLDLVYHLKIQGIVFTLCLSSSSSQLVCQTEGLGCEMHHLEEWELLQPLIGTTGIQMGLYYCYYSATDWLQSLQDAAL